MAKKHIKTYLTALDIREIKIKITVRYYYIPTRMTEIIKNDNSNGSKATGILMSCQQECKMV